MLKCFSVNLVDTKNSDPRISSLLTFAAQQFALVFVLYRRKNPNCLEVLLWSDLHYQPSTNKRRSHTSQVAQHSFPQENFCLYLLHGDSLKNYSIKKKIYTCDQFFNQAAINMIRFPQQRVMMTTKAFVKDILSVMWFSRESFSFPKYPHILDTVSTKLHKTGILKLTDISKTPLSQICN